MENIDSLKNNEGEIEREDIKKIIPYEDPFLMIDKVTKLDKKTIIATKQVNQDEFWVKGHFVDFPIMPGALIIEGFGQAATLLLRYNIPDHQEKEILAYKIKKVTFSYPTLPGDNLRFEIKMGRKNEKGAVFKGKVFVNEKQCSEVKLILAIVDRKRFRNKFTKG
jgi:3-hydroxymyristoyl/3-hydroxydecanoyl-(acyl carrier protein) dehydratase